MSRLRAITPFMRVTDLDAAIAFFTNTLGFSLGFRGGEYAYVHRDDVAVRMVADEPLPPRGEGRYISYIDVEDVDALFEELKPALDRLPAGHVNPLCDQPYGQREFAVIAPDGDLIGFGSPTPQPGET
ncbi:bleomycin resistance protein [Brevundimonas faecalis]|uniref:bleomycin resistance protein n=1 Tax=Brevundimonas faecalis TaxID=947378 RepID=UPI003611DE00